MKDLCWCLEVQVTTSLDHQEYIITSINET
jgi:hypothetical protein